MSNPCKTPAEKKKEDYEDYDLSPPTLPESKQRTFEAAVEAIENDFEELLRVEWVSDAEERKVVWFKKRGDGTEVELPRDVCRILLFLYSRNFKKHEHRDSRRFAVRDMLKKGTIRKVILQVIACIGDSCLSSDEDYRAHYIRACLTILRYFQQTGASGFVPDMSTLTYYLRMQKFGSSCFLQAACVAMSYFLQACGRPVPPPNASGLIRHHFDDEQLIKYVEDCGGDSVAIYKILEEKFFLCQTPNRYPNSIFCHDLGDETFYKAATELLEQAPGLVSKFIVPHNFICSPPSSDLKEKFPELAPYENWGEIPAHLIPPGVARFTNWNEAAEFIPLDAPSDENLRENENVLKEKWEKILCPTEENDGLTAVTASMSEDSGNNGSQRTPSERSTTGASMFTEDDSDGEEWSHFLDEDEDDSSSASSENNDPGEGADETPLHAMILLGHYEEDGMRYWLLQNSWEGPTQIIEVTTEYFIRSGAFLYFYKRKFRSPKPEHEWNIKCSGFFCSSPVAESSQLERSDCENWSDALVHSVPQRTHDLDLDDILNEW